MKKNLILLAALATFSLSSCSNKAKEDNYSWLKTALDRSVVQLTYTANEIGDSVLLPRAIWTGYDMNFLCKQLDKDSLAFKDSLRLKPVQKLGQRRYCFDIYDWTSGFFPGSLWYTYEMTGNETLKAQAVKFTNYLNPVKGYKGTHDIGFMMNCSYGNAERLAPNDSVLAALVQTADNLCSRYNDTIGCIRSWDFGHWNFPVIIDNMMNLDLLFNVSRLTGDEKYKLLALKHAETTMKNHFRSDYSSYHVVSYNNDGTVEEKCTHQGKNDESAWARGQAWGVYGYTSCYRESKDARFLNQAEKIAELIMTRVKTEDLVPYWDYDAPASAETPRDASAASITASALLELSTLIPDGQKYFDYAEKLLKSLSSETYLASEKENKGFILMHSTGSLPNGSEIDTPINYADYYYLEALQRYMNIKGIKYNQL